MCPTNDAMPNDDTSKVDSEATEWLVRLDDSPTVETREAYRAWLGKDPANAMAAARIEKHWQTFQGARALASSAENSERPDPDLLLKLAGGKRSAPRSPRLWVTASSLAALFAVVVSLWAFWGSDESQPQILSSGAGAVARFALDDGSVVKLNRNSRALIEYTPDRRGVTLVRGEAHFEVRKDAQRPFVVAVHDYAVRAVGTAFNVRFSDTDIEIVVTEGRVALELSSDVSETTLEDFRARPEGAPVLESGDRATLNVQDAEALSLEKLDPAAIDDYLSWRSIKLEFNGESLAEVVAAFNRYNERQIRIEDPAVGQIQIGGSFNAENVDALVHLLTDDGRVRVEEGPSGVIVLREADSPQ